MFRQLGTFSGILGKSPALQLADKIRVNAILRVAVQAGLEFSLTKMATHYPPLGIFSGLKIIAIAFWVRTKSGVWLTACKLFPTIITRDYSLGLDDFLPVRQSPTLLVVRNVRFGAIPGGLLVPWRLKDRTAILAFFLNPTSLYGGHQMEHPMRLVVICNLLWGQFVCVSEILPEFFLTLLG